MDMHLSENGRGVLQNRGCLTCDGGGLQPCSLAVVAHNPEPDLGPLVPEAGTPRLLVLGSPACPLILLQPPPWHLAV